MKSGFGGCWWRFIQVVDVGLGYCHGGFGVFEGTDWGFPYVWCVIVFVRFEFEVFLAGLRFSGLEVRGEKGSTVTGGAPYEGEV